MQKPTMLTLNNQNHCEELKIHFSNIGKNISSKTDPPPTRLMTFLMSLSLTNLCTFPPTNIDESDK